MNAREFFDAVVKMRKADKEYYSYNVNHSYTEKQRLLEVAREAERMVDAEISRVQAVLQKQQDTQQEITFN